jgi:amino-acid N-acetyltransferase
MWGGERSIDAHEPEIGTRFDPARTACYHPVAGRDRLPGAAKGEPLIRKACMRDVVPIHNLVNRFARDEVMLPVSYVDLYDRLRDFWVWQDDTGGMAGVMALHFAWEGLAEVRSLAVEPAHQGAGIARALVRRGVEEAEAFECTRVFTLTYVPAFFQKMGFAAIDKSELPHKVWADCIKCPKFPDCGEVALAMDLGPAEAAGDT